MFVGRTDTGVFVYLHTYIYIHTRTRACYAIAIIIISINNMMIISNCNGIGSSILSYFSNDMRHATLALLTTTLWRLKHPSPEAARLLYSFPTFSKCHKLACWQHDLRFFRNVCVCVCMHMCAMRLVIHQLRCVADSVVAGLLALNLTQLNRAQPHSTRRGAFQFDLKYMKCLLCMQPNAINSMKRRQGECCVLRKYSNCLASSTLSMCMCAIGRLVFCSLPHLIWHFGLLFSC